MNAGRFIVVVQQMFSFSCSVISIQLSELTQHSSIHSLCVCTFVAPMLQTLGYYSIPSKTLLVAWTTLCVWMRDHRVHPPRCPSTWMANSRQSLDTTLRKDSWRLQLREVLCMLDVDRTQHGRHPLLHSRRHHLHRKSGDLTGRRPRC
jgi:hypothetical protein